MSVKNIPYTTNSVRVVISNEVTYTNILTQMNAAITGLGWTLWDSVDNWIPGSPILFTATISGTAMTVSAVSSGALAVGQTVTGSGVTGNSVITVAPASQLTGSYTLSQSSTVGSATAMSVVSSNASPMFLRVYRALNADAVTYKYFIIWYDIRKQAFWTGTCESWDATNHVATNLAWNNNGSFVQNYDIKDSFIWVSATARHIVIWPFVTGEPGLWTGVFEFERIAPEDTVANAAPCWAWTNSVIIGTQFSDGTISQHVSPSKTMFAFPRTQDGLTGAAAAGVYAPVTNRGSFPPSYPSGTMAHGGASFFGFIGSYNSETQPSTVLTVQAMNAGTITVGSLIRGPGVVPGTRIVSFGTGTGGTGSYNVNIAQQAGCFFSTYAGVLQVLPMTSGADPHLMHLASAHNAQYGWAGAPSDASFRPFDRSFVSPISVDAIGKNMPFGRMYNVSVAKPIGSALEVVQTTLDSSGGWASNTGNANDAVVLPMNGGSIFPYFFSAFTSTYQAQNNRMHSIRIANPGTTIMGRVFLLGDYLYGAVAAQTSNGGIWRTSISSILNPTNLNALFTPAASLSAVSPTWTQIYQNTSGVAEMLFDGERTIYATTTTGQTLVKIDTETLIASTITITNGSQGVRGPLAIDNKYIYVCPAQVSQPTTLQLAIVDMASFTQTGTYTGSQTNGTGGYPQEFFAMPNYSGHVYVLQLSLGAGSGYNSWVYTVSSSTGVAIPITNNSNNAYINFTAVNGNVHAGNLNASGGSTLYMDPCTSTIYYIKQEGNSSVFYYQGLISRVSSAANPTAISTITYSLSGLFALTPVTWGGNSADVAGLITTALPFQGFIKGRMYFKQGGNNVNPFGRAILSDPNNSTPGNSTSGLYPQSNFTVGNSLYWVENYGTHGMFTNGPRMCIAAGYAYTQTLFIKNIYSMHSTEGEVTARLLVKA